LSAVNLTGLDIALKTLPYVESLPARGDYVSYGSHCEGETCTFLNTAYPQSRAWPVLAYAQLYDVTGDKVYLDKANSTMERLLSDCDPNTNVRCYYIGVQADAAYRLIGDDRYLDYLRGVDITQVYLEDREDEYMKTAIMSRQLAVAYKNGLYPYPHFVLMGLDVAERGLKSMNPLIVQGGVGLPKHACWTYLGWTEFYKVLSDEEGEFIVLNYSNTGPIEYNVSILKASVLRKMRNFYDGFSFETLSSNPEVYALTLTDLEPCAEGLLDMYGITSDKRYKQKAVSLLEGLLDRHWDSEYLPKYAGDNSFTSQGCRKSGEDYTCYRANKILTDNAYAIYLFARLKDEVFQVNALETGAATPQHNPVKYFKVPQEDPELVKPASTSITRPVESGQKKDRTSLFAISLIVVLVVFYASYKLLSKK